MHNWQSAFAYQPLQILSAAINLAALKLDSSLAQQLNVQFYSLHDSLLANHIQHHPEGAGHRAPGHTIWPTHRHLAIENLQTNLSPVSLPAVFPQPNHAPHHAGSRKTPHRKQSAYPGEVQKRLAQDSPLADWGTYRQLAYLLLNVK